MEIAALANKVTNLLTPALPSLSLAGSQPVKGAGRPVTAAAQALWGKLRPRLETDALARQALTETVLHPGDPDAQEALRARIQKLLRTDLGLAVELANLLRTHAVADIEVAAHHHPAAAVAAAHLAL